MRLVQAQAHIGASATRVLGKPDAAVRQKLCRLDLPDRRVDQFAELAPLFVRDCGSEVLDLNQSLADEVHLRYIRDSGDPGIAEQLGIES